MAKAGITSFAMCNLYRLGKGKEEVAKWFEAVDEAGGANFSAEVFPGYPGLVIADGAVRSMNWGFPLVLKGKQGQKLKPQKLKPRPVNNARSDKLDRFFWRSSFEKRRCLIPLTAWAEAEGAMGQMTRSWLSLPDSEMFACAGVWRPSDEWGDCYSMVMTDAAGLAAQVHTRMPVILHAKDHALWVNSDNQTARDILRPWDGELTLDRTNEPWSGGAAQSRLL